MNPEQQTCDYDSLLQLYMKSHLDSEHMMISNVGKGTSRRMILLYKVKGLPVDMNNFVNDKKYYVMPDEGINWKSMVRQLKIEAILFDFINFLSRSPDEWRRVRDFNNLLTESECFHYGLTNKKTEDFDILLTIFELFPNLFTIKKFTVMSGSFSMKARLKEDDDAFLATLSIAAKASKNSSSYSIFHTLPGYCKMKFSDSEDFCSYFLQYTVEPDFRNNWNQIRHFHHNYVIHFDEGRYYLLFKFEAFQRLNLEDISNSPDFFCVPHVGFHFKPFIDWLRLDKLLVKFIRFKLEQTHQWVASQKMIDDYVGIINECLDTEKYNNIRALTKTIVKLFPSIWKTKKTKLKIKLADVTECQPTRERLVLEILRAEQGTRPTSMKQLFEALPDHAKHQFRSPLKLQEFCQQIVALQDEFTALFQNPLAHNPVGSLSRVSKSLQGTTKSILSESLQSQNPFAQKPFSQNSFSQNLFSQNPFLSQNPSVQNSFWVQNHFLAQNPFEQSPFWVQNPFAQNPF